MTLRELLWLAKGAWKRTAGLMALLANCHRDKKLRPTPFTPTEFNPFEKKEPQRKQGIEISFRQFEIAMTRAMRNLGFTPPPKILVVNAERPPSTGTD